MVIIKFSEISSGQNCNVLCKKKQDVILPLCCMHKQRKSKAQYYINNIIKLLMVEHFQYPIVSYNQCIYTHIASVVEDYAIKGIKRDQNQNRFS